MVFVSSFGKKMGTFCPSNFSLVHLWIHKTAINCLYILLLDFQKEVLKCFDYQTRQHLHRDWPKILQCVFCFPCNKSLSLMVFGISERTVVEYNIGHFIQF